MEAPRWQHLKELFFQAMDLPASDRAAWLEQVSPRALRAELERLLAADADPSLLLDVPHGHLVQLADAAPAPAPEARSVGPYRIVRELGRGGMGTVYLAERADGAFEQRVALKVIRRGIDTDDVIRRFEQERQILASLNHENIARLFDGGTSEAGLPYFAMEYIDGVPITTYCDDRRLTVDERLRLFEGACAAVQYAHQNLVVHRDLKPSNMLVIPATGTGSRATVKLLDFGIAKVLGAAQPDAIQTQTGLRILTPAYASPEQRRGGPVTTASDVYALGIVLYELLTGRRPATIPPDQAAPIDTAAPKRPSAAVAESRAAGTISEARSTTAERLRRQLSGDLDTIVLKALREEPERRYASAEAFVDDLRRYLAGLPVRARRDTLGYRARKFVQRHRAGMGAAAAGLALLVGGGVFHTVRVSRERDAARQEAQKAAQVTQFLVDLLQESNPNVAPGGTATVREVLDKGTARLQIELRDQPALQAHLLETIGEVYYGLGLYEEAGRQAEELLALQRQIHGSRHVAVAAAMRRLARIRHHQSRFDEAYALSHQALQLHRALLGDTHPEAARSLEGAAMALRMLEKNDEAEALLRQAVAIDRRLPPPSPVLAQSLTSLAHVIRRRRPVETEALHHEALALRRQALGEEHPHVAETLINLAGVAMDRRQYDQAERYFIDGLAMRRRTQGEDHPEIGVDLGGLARLYRETGNPAAAERTHREALAHLRRTLSPGHEETIVNLYALAQLLLKNGRPDEAEPLLREALAGRQATHPAGHWLVAEARSLLGAALTDRGRFPEAEALLVQAYSVLAAERGREDAYTQETLERLVALYEAWGRPDQAARYRIRLNKPAA